MATNLITDLHTESTASFARTPPGEVFITNGIDRPRKWDGFSSSAVVAGLDGPDTAPTVSEAASGNSELGTYYVAYRFGDAYGNYSNLSPVTEVTTTATGKKFNWTTVPIASGTDSSSRITKRQLFRTLVDDAEVFYLVAEINDNSTTSYSTDTASDDDLSDNSELPVLNDDDSLNANRFGVPPANKAVAVWNQDRLFFLGDVDYDTGTVSVSSGSGSVTGSGTSFSKYMVGKWIWIAGDSRGREITAYSSTTGITVSPVAGSTISGAAYVIKTAPAERNVIYFSEPEEPESVPQSQNQFLIQENGVQQDEVVGGFSDAGTLIIGMRNHLYQFNYQRQPHLDGAASLIARRGMFNHRCHGQVEGVHFLMDRFGPYMLSGGQVRDIGESVRNLFNDLDETYVDRFFVSVNQREKTARFHVRFTGDTAQTRALSYNYELDRWQENTYPWGLGAACEMEVGGSLIPIAFTDEAKLLIESMEDSADWVATQVVAVATTGTTGSTVKAESGTFASSQIGAPIVFIDGAAAGELRVISSVTGTDTAGLSSSLPSGAAVGDRFVIGGVAWSWKSGLLDFPRDNQTQGERSIDVTFKPHDTNYNFISIRHYLNHKASPETAEMDYPGGDEACSQIAGRSDGFVDIYKNRDANYETVGFARKTFSSKHAHYGISDRWVSAELRGVAVGDPVEVYEVAVTGAK
jgi:hypothetical protein